MKNQRNHAAETESRIPGWWLVAKKELTELWVGGRAMVLMLLFSILLGIVTFLLATNSEMKLMPPREMLYLTIQNTIAVGLFLGLIVGADSISGERERATLESLLLVPATRRQIVIGKFVAALSPWPVALLMAALHLNILAPNPEAFIQSLLLCGVMGSLLVVGFTGFGVLLSLWSESNRSSLFISMFTSVLFLIPTQFPGTAQTGFMGRLVKRINPMESVNQFVEKILVNNRALDEMISWTAAPIIFAILVLVILFWYSAPRLALEAKKSRLTWPSNIKPGTVPGILLLAVLISPLLMASPARAQKDAADPILQITTDQTFREVKTGDTTEITTVVHYTGEGESPSMIVAMNIVNLGEGEPVDPEDWSPERSQEVEPLLSGESTEQTWIVNAIFEGDYMVYMTVIPEPEEGAGETSQPVSSPGIHLLVSLYSPLNPGGVLPVSLGMPIVLGAIYGVQIFLRRRERK